MMWVPSAYKYVAIAVMLAEINYCAGRLHLPMHLPANTSAVQRAFIPPAAIMGFSGYLDVQNYRFSFPPGQGVRGDLRSQRLCFITRLDNGYQAYSATRAQGALPTSDFLRQLVALRSTINTNGAYEIASNWLAAIDVNVSRLECENPVTVEHEQFNGHPLPLFDVYWGKRGYIYPENRGPKVMIKKVDILIDGVTGGLLHLRENDPTYSMRPFVLIKNIAQLMAIPDSEFRKYSAEQRKELVARFAAVKYQRSLVANPEIDGLFRGSGTTNAAPRGAVQLPSFKVNWPNWKWSDLSHRKMSSTSPKRGSSTTSVPEAKK